MFSLMLNKQMLIGYVGQDPEIINTAEGNICARFRLATTERGFVTARGQSVPERTTWHNIECWGGLAKVVKDNVRTGSRLYVEGIHHTRDYQTADGRKDTWHSCDISYLEFLDAKKEQQ